MHDQHTVENIVVHSSHTHKLFWIHVVLNRTCEFHGSSTEETALIEGQTPCLTEGQRPRYEVIYPS